MDLVLVFVPSKIPSLKKKSEWDFKGQRSALLAPASESYSEVTIAIAHCDPLGVVSRYLHFSKTVHFIWLYDNKSRF